MTPLNNSSHSIREAKRLVESESRSEIKHNANGGNSILIVCDPMQEVEYIAKIEELLPTEKYTILDLNECLIEFISQHLKELTELFEQLKSATNQIFKAPDGENSEDLFKVIIKEIKKSLKDDKVPVLINTGALYGTGIHNIHIMENENVMTASLPLIILYPATMEPDRLMFLGKQSASKYRCMIIK
jgi:hypothetical protein